VSPAIGTARWGLYLSRDLLHAELVFVESTRVDANLARLFGEAVRTREVERGQRVPNRGFDAGLEARPISRVAARRGACFEIRAHSKSRVDGLALKRQNAEHTLVHASQRLIASESLECLEA
jgi:hypothetical protein